jgi:hypothetical protein
MAVLIVSFLSIFGLVFIAPAAFSRYWNWLKTENYPSCEQIRARLGDLHIGAALVQPQPAAFDC